MWIIEPETKPSFEAELKKECEHIESDQNVALTCKVSGNPLPNVTWYSFTLHFKKTIHSLRNSSV